MALTADQITGPVARELRGTTPQTTFWGAVGVSQSVGSRYENDHTEGIPRPVQILIVLRYVLGIDIDVQTAEGLEYLRKLAQYGKSLKVARQSSRELRAVAAKINGAADSLQAL